MSDFRAIVARIQARFGNALIGVDNDKGGDDPEDQPIWTAWVFGESARASDPLVALEAAFAAAEAANPTPGDPHA